MYCIRNVAGDLYWAGANDHRLTLFENAYPIPRGITYNSYLLLDGRTVIFDTIDWSACRQLVENTQHMLKDRPLDYPVINHLEPDHVASIDKTLLHWPDVTLINNEEAFMLMRQLGSHVDSHKIIGINEGNTFSFGKHTVTFVFAPMVHWPEVMVMFGATNGILFPTDALNTFGTLDGKLFADGVNFDHDWLDSTRRYPTNIVGKYGLHIQLLLKRTDRILDQIKYICPLHGPVWCKDLMHFIQKYDIWSRYGSEEKGVLVVYASIYSNAESAAQALAVRLCDKGMISVVLYDVSPTSVSQLISKTFKYSHLVLVSVTYNLGIYPAMRNYLLDVKVLDVQKRTVAIVKSGSWACKSGDLMQKFLMEEMKDMTVFNERVSVASALGENKEVGLDTLVDAILDSMNEKE